jgi:hypothetical protein
MYSSAHERATRYLGEQLAKLSDCRSFRTVGQGLVEQDAVPTLWGDAQSFEESHIVALFAL